MIVHFGRRWIAGTVAGVAFLSACGPNTRVSTAAPQSAPLEAPEQSAQRAAESWLDLVDHAMYETSWDSAATSMQRAVPRTQWRDVLLQARAPYEPFGARRLLSRQYTTALPKAPPGEYVVLQFATVVNDGHTVTETVVPMREGGVWRVSGYFIRPQ